MEFNLKPELFKKENIPGVGYVIGLIAFTAIISLALAPLSKMLIKFDLFKDWIIFINYVITYSLVLFVSLKIWNIKKLDTTHVPLLVFALLAPLVIAMLLISEFIISFIPMPDRIAQLFADMIQLDAPGYLTVGIAAPILEELIFRGVILKAFLKKFKPKHAIFWSAFLFGFFHMNPWQFIPAFFIGLVIGWLYYKTKSIWPGLFIHFANNSTSFLMAWKYQDINVGFKDLINNSTTYHIILGSAIIIGIGVIFTLQNMLNNKQTIQTNECI